MTTSTRRPLAGRVVVALAVVLMLAAVALAGLVDSSASSLPLLRVETAVGVIGEHTTPVVGAHEAVLAGDRRIRGPDYDLIASGSSVAAETDILATPEVESGKLQNIVNDLYKGTTNSGRVGTGTTADAIRYELETGEEVFGRSHIQKGEDYLRGLENWLKANPDAPYHDRLVARSLADDLLDALGRSP